MTDINFVSPQLPRALAAYRLTPGERLVNETPFLALACPHGISTGHITRAACVTNLIDRTQRTATIELADLVRIAQFHDEPEPSIERTRHWSELYRQLGDVGAYTLHADLDEHSFLVMSCPYRGGRCPGSQDGECVANLIPEGLAVADLGTVVQLAIEHDNARYGVPASRLAALRETWAARKEEASCIRKIADGWSADRAGERADLVGRMLAELDLAVNGERVPR
ncbi:hypothetical protein [Nonomuraea sp. GTA35]|uniref:hypothetical protein n=1 Tax=Nonomuraea sp. GTA35 TaxID=1676746 RepID=UPI0035BF7D92